MMSSVGSQNEFRDSDDVEFSAHLVKPVKQSKLYDCLAEILRGSGQASLPSRPVHGTTGGGKATTGRRACSRILLAEDNRVNQKVAIKLLEKMGHRVTAVSNGEEAVKALEEGSFDLVLMDIQMPVMDGFASTAMIRSNAAAGVHPRIPIIAMTAHAMRGDRERCLANGMDDYISKPVQPSSLLEIVERWLPETPRERNRPPGAGSGLDKPGNPHQVPRSEVPESEHRHSSVPVWDRAGLLKRLMDDEDFLSQMVKVALDDLPLQLESLQNYLDDSDLSQIERQSHSIKGAAANLGAESMCEVAARIEQAAREGKLEEVTGLLADLHGAFGCLRGEMTGNGMQAEQSSPVRPGSLPAHTTSPPPGA